MSFRSHAFAEFVRQLTFAPPRRRRSHMDRAEALYWELDPQREYPLDFVVYRITRYRPDTFKLTSIRGDELGHDLLVLVERLSESLDDAVEACEPRPLSLPELQKRLNVTSKTIQRYRRRGLFARRMVYPDGRRRLAFLPESIDRFVAERGDGQTRRAERFTRMDEPTRHAIITRARRLVAGRPDLTPFQVARHLGPRMGRSVEAVRQVLVRHDRRDPRVAVFPGHVPPLTEKQQRVIHRAYHRGVHVSTLARRFGKSRHTIYRAIHRRRAAAIRELPLHYVSSPTFDLPDADQIILESALPESTEKDDGEHNGKQAAARDGEGGDVSSLYGDEPLGPQLERALFVRYNYLKHRAAQLREQIDPASPRSSDLDRIETWLRRAVAVKVRILRANLRLVVSVARKHLATRSDRRGPGLSELIAEGNTVLLRSIETYDAGRGNRFSAYLAWSLMRRFASFTADSQSRQRRTPAFDRAAGDYWPLSLNPAQAAVLDSHHMASELGQLLDELTDHERFIVTRHFGLGEQPHRLDPQPLAVVARELDLSVERARQIERRGVARLRQAAARLHLAHPLSDGAGDGQGGANVSSTREGTSNEH